MSVNNLNKQLQQLQEELSELRLAEKHLQTKINTVLLELDQALNEGHSATESKEKPLAFDDIADLVRKFEADHPALTDSVNRVLLTLSNMGI